jgi:hypothetical protein
MKISRGSSLEIDMSKHSYVVKVHAPHPSVYNPDRPITDLVRNQILHLSLAERHLPKRHRTEIDIYSIKTERQASEYIHHLTKRLHPQGARKLKVAKKVGGHTQKNARKKNKSKPRRK